MSADPAEKKTWLPVAVLVPVFILILTGVPTVLGAGPIIRLDQTEWKLGYLFLAPAVFALSLVCLAITLSFPFQGAIIPGKFPRQMTHFVYGPRRLYGLCWGAVFYFTPIYFAFMSVPLLRRFLMRGFGYRGHGDVVIAPDAWLRDLPLLKFSQGAYVANKATIGTNICLANSSILVDRVTLGQGAMIGHLSMLAPGALIGDRSEIGVGCAIGIRARIGNQSRVGPTTSINHGAMIGNSVDIGSMSYVGVKAKIADGVRLPSGSNIPEGAVIENQEQVAQFISSEARVLQAERERLAGVMTTRMTRIPKSREAKIP